MKAIILIALALTAIAQLQPKCDQGMPDIEVGLSQDFQDWLNNNGYGNWSFERTDLTGGAYGGRDSANDTIVNKPIIFFHGNSDIAVGDGGSVGWQTGFKALITYLQSKGYKKSEMYITTWGPANPNEAEDQTHSCAYVQRLRAFTEAVMKYTNATTFDAVSHSMGVSLARKVLKGGTLKEASDSCDIGSNLNSQFDTFVGLAGACLGLQVCEFDFSAPTCNKVNGFFPGIAKGNPLPLALSTYMNDINSNGGREAENVFTVFAYPFDTIIGMETIFGHNTSDILYQNASLTHPGTEYTHFDIRDATCGTVYSALTTHSLN